ncbi:MAG: T9SS type A sorting domain-containing protein, partial [Candidatus Cloacimonetes bacterium]|nr:T9SS type A sorting domain-containing protein [Candidatus Cloacimonadota bacterium]
PDSIIYCQFTNNDCGLRALSSSYSPTIESCSFSSSNFGIVLCSASPLISNCTFSDCGKGILSELEVKATTMTNGIFNCNFQNCGAAIESRNANHRVQACLFNENQCGILSHAGSNLNLSENANNILRNHQNNIEFSDTHSYEASIQLLHGRNDFYHLYDDENDTYANDFYFDFLYWWYIHNASDPPAPLHRFSPIYASYNWFEGDEVRYNAPHSNNNYVVVNYFDPAPNMDSFVPENNRISLAMEYESSGNYLQALTLYMAIMDDQLEEEADYLPYAVDGVYRLADKVDTQAVNTSAYLSAKLAQYSEVSSTTTSLIRNYLVKENIYNKDYQNAIDNIQLAISNPASEADSLLAVMDLEIVLHLAAMESSKRPAVTNYQQYVYPNLQVFNTKHEEHWEQLYALLDKKPATEEIPIPSVPLIATNYPNPFNPSTTIAFSIPTTYNTKLSVYNIKGQKVKELINNELASGYHKIIWDGRDKNNRGVSSGIYFFRLQSGGKVSVRKAMLMK